MRLRKHEINQRVNGNLKIEFAKQDVSSYSGLELFRRYFRLINLNNRIRKAFRVYKFNGDYTIVDYVLVFIALWLTGGRRLRQVAFIAEDPLVQRLCGLKNLPSDRSISGWLKQFTNDSLQSLVNLNSEIVFEKLKELGLPRITLDFDGTVLSCGNKVAWAFRGYNPHKHYAKSYYPLLCHIGQTGHFLQVRNRPGNTHDSKGGALQVMKNCIEYVRQELPGIIIEVRIDAAFFTNEIIGYLEREKIEFAVRVPMWSRLYLKDRIILRQRWHHSDNNISWFKEEVYIETWDKEVELIFFRKKISESSPKSPFQLDLFSPDDGVYEYSVLYSNKKIEPQNIMEFYNGRCSMEHQIAEIKDEFGFDTVPTNHYGANSAHQQISVFAYNLVRNFQMDAQLAKSRTRTRKRTNILKFESLRSLRFEWITLAGRLLRPDGINTLRLNKNSLIERKFNQILDSLNQLAA